MNENKLRRLFPRAGEAFIKANSDKTDDPRTPSGGKQAQEWVSETLGNGKVEAQYRLRHVEIEFFANHGKRLDEDNRRYAAKPILDALVNLGFARDDKDITTETAQRMDDSKANI